MFSFVFPKGMCSRGGWTTGTVACKKYVAICVLVRLKMMTTTKKLKTETWGGSSEILQLVSWCWHRRSLDQCCSFLSSSVHNKKGEYYHVLPLAFHYPQGDDFKNCWLGGPQIWLPILLSTLLLLVTLCGISPFMAIQVNVCTWTHVGCAGCGRGILEQNIEASRVHQIKTGHRHCFFPNVQVLAHNFQAYCRDLNENQH